MDESVKCPHCGSEDDFMVEKVVDIDVLSNIVEVKARCFECDKIFFIDWDLINPTTSAN